MAGLGSGSAGTLDPAAYYYSHSILDNDPYIDPKTLLPPSESTKQWIADEQQMSIFQHIPDENAPTVIQQEPAFDQSIYILTSSNSALLRKNLINGGYAEPLYGNAAHHIVAANDKRANFAKSVLAKYGVDIDSADNGVFLPTKDGYIELNHRKIHTDDYYKNVDEMLSGAKSKDDVIDGLHQNRKELTDGTFSIRN
ncbi:hypothetical protein BC351_18415 [Paenibacillus ferrarius]|uniref:Uncharacterized protein n=2 Tax=Paenibacillus ferrarius TaxID=1469647 RepID=A0A1V4HQB4_9BACL|nr:hypothetical protein BC351_18415 [Paenibacillus ferrarius]